MGRALLEIVREAGRREDVGAIVLTGGRKLFAAGADVAAMAEMGPDEVRPVVAALGDALELLESTPKVSIAAINGYALGGGLEIALAADLRYLAEDARVGQPEVKLGVFPGAGGTQRLGRLTRMGFARDLIYSGRQVGSAEAERRGLADRVLPPDDLLAAAVADAAVIAAGPRQAIAAAKTALRAAAEVPRTAALDTPDRVVTYPEGRYQLYGDGRITPYYWVWVPNGSTAIPPPPSVRSRRST